MPESSARPAPRRALIRAAGSALLTATLASPLASPLTGRRPALAQGAPPAAAPGAAGQASPPGSPGAANGSGPAAPPATPGSNPPPGPAGELRLGALFPFSGTLALFGDESFRGLELAVEERNAAGPLLGRSLRLVRGDATDPGQAAAELRRLANGEHVAGVFGTGTSALGFAASQAAELASLPYFELGAVADAITERGFRYLFRTCPNARDFARVAADAITGVPLAPLGLGRAALLHEDSMDGQGLAGAVEARLKELGAPAPERIGYSARTVELGSIVQRLRGIGAELLLHAGQQNDIVLLFRAMKDNGWKPRMVMGLGAGYSLADTARTVGPDFDGTLNVDVPQYEARPQATPGAAEFAAGYKRKYGSEPRSGLSLASYVGARVVLDALGRAGAADKDRWRAALLGIDVPEGGTANGWGVRFDERGQNIRARPFLLQWQGGRQVTLLPAEAASAPLRARLGP